jgi:hypothetical protein
MTLCMVECIVQTVRLVMLNFNVWIVRLVMPCLREIGVICQVPFLFDNHVVQDYACCHYVTNLDIVPTICRSLDNSPP